MIQDDFDAYKKAVRQHYEKEKEGIYSSFLWQPSRANLRKLCVERFKENPSVDDLKTFRMFMGFEFSPEHRNRLKEETDRFRNIENFLKGITDTGDRELVNLTAVLVDFNPRPFLKFKKSTIDKNEDSSEVLEDDQPLTPNPTPDTNKKSNLKKKLIFGFLGLTALCSVGYTAKDLVLPNKECMQWQGDHYVEIDCQDETNSFYASSPIVPFDDRTSTLKRVTVSDTTKFFREDGKPLIWYCKVKGKSKPDYFNEPGLHPITGKALRPITVYMIDKYVKK